MPRRGEYATLEEGVVVEGTDNPDFLVGRPGDPTLPLEKYPLGGAGGILGDKRSFATGSRVTAATTNIRIVDGGPGIGIYTPVLGAMTPGLDVDFTLDGSGLIWTYDGPDRIITPLVVNYYGSCEKENGGVDENFLFNVHQNGAPAGASVPIATRQGSPVSFQAQIVTFADTGDTFQLFVQNISSNDNIITILYCYLDGF